MTGRLTITVEPDGSLIRVHGEGLFTPEAARRHFAELKQAMRSMRSQRGSARVLVDMRDAGTQSAEVADIIREETDRAYAPQDLAAILCHSVLQTLQMRRSGPQGRKREFAGEQVEDALAWLRSSHHPSKTDDRSRSRA